MYSFFLIGIFLPLPYNLGLRYLAIPMIPMLLPYHPTYCHYLFFSSKRVKIKPRTKPLETLCPNLFISSFYFVVVFVLTLGVKVFL